MPNDSAQILYLDERDQFEFTPPNDPDGFEAEDVAEGGLTIFEDPDTGKLFLVTTFNYEEGDLEPDMCYELVKCSTEVADDDDEDEDDDEEEAIDPTLTDPVSEENK